MSDFSWNDIAIFIAAPRELSARRFAEIVKRYLPKGNILLGIAKEPYVVGFEDQPQFAMLQQKAIQAILDKVDSSASPHKIYTLSYSQNELLAVLDNLHEGQRVLLVNGSWKYAFHNSESYKLLTSRNIGVKFISPFVDEDEAKAYLEMNEPFIELPHRGDLLTGRQMLAAADKAAQQSFDYSFQTGVALGKKHDDKYAIIATTFNKVIPYQTYALHHGNSREKYLSPPHDANHYDTIHAEMQLLVEATRGEIELEGTTLFVNLLPCPNCARTLSQTAIEEIIYRHDHSSGYAHELLELCGKKVKQFID